jgi:hypothetical protein
MEQILHLHFPVARRSFQLAFAQSLSKRPKVPPQVAVVYSAVVHQFLACRYAPQIRRALQDGCNYFFFGHVFFSIKKPPRGWLNDFAFCGTGTPAGDETGVCFG